MRCAKVTQLLSAYLDGELKPSEAEKIREHLDSCPECSKELQALKATIRSVQDLPAMRAPDNLASRVLADIEKLETQPSPQANVVRARFRMRMLWPAAAALLLGVGIALFSPSARRNRPEEIVSAPDSRRVAMSDADSRARRENARIGEDLKVLDNSYAFWKEDDLASQSDESESVNDRLVMGLRGEKDLEGTGLAGRLRRGASIGDLHLDHYASPVADAPRTREFEILSEDPQAAYAKVAAISARFARMEKPLTGDSVGRVLKSAREEAAPQRLVLRVTSSQLGQIRKEIVAAGLVATDPAESARARTFAATATAEARSTAKEALRMAEGKTPTEAPPPPEVAMRSLDTEASLLREAQLAKRIPERKRGEDLVPAEIIAPSAKSKEQRITIAGGRAPGPKARKLSIDKSDTRSKQPLPEPLRSVNDKVAEVKQKQSPLQPSLGMAAAELADEKPASAPGGRAGGRIGGAEPLIRVSISFIKIDEKAAAVQTEPKPADVDALIEAQTE